jgi:hypothetical protein
MKQKVLIFLSIFLVFLSFSLFYYFELYLPQKRLTEAKKRLEEVQKDIERLKKFDEEKYAEKITNILSFENFISTTTDIQLEGVEIIPKGDRKLVINHAEGYEIEVPNDVILNQTWSTKNLHFDALDAIKTGMPPHYWTVIYIWVWDKERDKQMFDEYYNDLKNPNITKLIINGQEFIKKLKQDEDPNDPDAGYYYKTIKDGKLYEISILSARLYEDFVKTFKFIEKNE